MNQLDQPVVIALMITFACTILAIVLGIYVANCTYNPFVSTREVEITDLTSVDVESLDLDVLAEFNERVAHHSHCIRIERIQAEIAESLKHGQYVHARLLHDEVTDLIGILTEL
jgi:hypothetical protein